MEHTTAFGSQVLVAAVGLVLGLAANQLSARIRVPAPALLLIVAASAATVFPVLGTTPVAVSEDVVTIALVVILFDGGMHIGLRRFRSAAGAIAWIGLAGTAVTAAAIAGVAVLIGFSPPAALLLGAALSPTDPAVVFSVLGKRDIAGRSGTILEGESGANDPIGIALLASLLAVLGGEGGGALSGGAVLGGVGEFLLQMGVGGAVGVAGGLLLARLMRVRLPNASLYPVRALAVAALVFGAATALHGSGFLAVFLAGILVGDVRAPNQVEVERFVGGVSGLAEIVAFTVLGLQVRWPDLVRPDVLWPALGIAAVLTVLIRPVLVGLLSLPIRLAPGERAFVLWAGLKGAVPILLGIEILAAGVPGAARVFDVIVVVVLVSVLVQGGLVPVAARLLRVPMTMREEQPYAAGLRFREEPRGLERHRVERGSVADGATLAELRIGDGGWVSMISRAGRPVQPSGAVRLEAGDEVLAFADPEVALAPVFRRSDQA